MTRSTKPDGELPEGYTDVEVPSDEDEAALDAAWASITDADLEASIRFLDAEDEKKGQH